MKVRAGCEEEQRQRNIQVTVVRAVIRLKFEAEQGMKVLKSRLKGTAATGVETEKQWIERSIGLIRQPGARVGAVPGD